MDLKFRGIAQKSWETCESASVCSDMVGAFTDEDELCWSAAEVLALAGCHREMHFVSCYYLAFDAHVVMFKLQNFVRIRQSCLQLDTSHMAAQSMQHFAVYSSKSGENSEPAVYIYQQKTLLSVVEWHSNFSTERLSQNVPDLCNFATQLSPALQKSRFHSREVIWLLYILFH